MNWKAIASATMVSSLVPALAAAQTSPSTGRSIEPLTHLTVRAPDRSRLLLGSRIAAGKPTLIAFWASWCLPCMVEAPHLAALRHRFGDRFNFLYVNRRDGEPDDRQPPAAIAQFMARSGLGDTDYLVADVATYQRIVGSDLATMPQGIVGIPRVYLFDRHGRQVYTALGFSDERSRELEDHLQNVVGGQ